MDAVIPAAGRSSRLGELTGDRPKGLVDVAGRPLLAHVFETASSNRLRDLHKWTDGVTK